MASNLPRYARILTATLAVAGLVLASAPMAFADPGARTSPAKERPVRPGPDFALALRGTGVDKDNNTYDVLIEGEGRGGVKKDAAGNATSFRGMAHLRIVVTSDNGTLVKDRELRAVLRAHLTDEGWVWTLHGFGQRRDGVPQVHLRGTATSDAPTLFDLDGHGRAAFAKTIPGPGLRMKIDSIEGSITRA